MTSRLLLAVLLAGPGVWCASTPGGKYLSPEGYVMVVTKPSPEEIIVRLSGSYRMNTCEMETGRLRIRDGTAVYQPSGDPKCRVEFHFRNQTARVRQTGNCGCGLNVNLSGVYRKSRR